MRMMYILLALMSHAAAFPEYPGRIPNGFRVPHPCFEESTWKGVGHQNFQGGGFLNPFGEDFRRNDYKWDECLCLQDSDGDGRTNGEELGDPDCNWTEDGDPVEVDNLGHPGICEPLNSENCEGKNNWEICKDVEFLCAGADDPDTEKLDLRFTEITVPNTETNYFCYTIEFDKDRDMHAFAMTPIIDNDLVVHHIDLNACENLQAEIYAKIAYNKPRSCEAMNLACNNMIASWGLGINGICLNEDVGIRVGPQGVTVAVLRIHYHNPTFLEGQTDTSGLRMFLTDNIRPYDAGIINFSQKYLEIPPGQQEYNAEIFCGPFCTNSFSEDVKVVFATMHMHLLGKGGKAELFRDGSKVDDIMVQDFYDYNSPQIKSFDPPLIIKAGDTIIHTCSFQSLDRTEVTWRGQAVTDEMCHLYLVMYPPQNMTNCNPDGKTERCRYLDHGTERDYESQGCDYNDFKDKYTTYMRPALEAVCDVTGKECFEGCNDTLNWALNNHTCLSGDAKYSCFRRNPELGLMQSSCKFYPPPYVGPDATTTPPSGECVFGASSQMTPSGIIMYIGMFFLGLIYGSIFHSLHGGYFAI